MSDREQGPEDTPDADNGEPDGEQGADEAGTRSPGRNGKGRSSVRQRNNKRIQEVKDRARIMKKIQVRCALADWERLLRSFSLAPCTEKPPDDAEEDAAGERCDRLACIRPRDVTQRSPPSVEVGGIHIGCRWVRNGKEGSWEGDLLDISDLAVERSQLRAVLHSQPDFERIVDERVRGLLAADTADGREPAVALGFCMYVKLKVELFETTLPGAKDEAPAIHSYAGPKKLRDNFPTIPDYVPDERFLDLNAQAQCWVAKTMVVRGIVQTTHYQVGPDHCFMPNETIFFRNNSDRFRKPVWVVSMHEERAFEELGEAFLVKKTLKKGDRFILMPAFDRVDGERENWRHIREEELVVDLLEQEGRPGRGMITGKTAEYFALTEPGRKVRVAHCDCTCLTVEVRFPAIIGRPLPEEFRSGIPTQADDPRSLPSIEHFMDLRGRLGFNAMGLLHNAVGDPDTADCWVECPLNRLSVMSPSSRLLFLDHWRDEQEQKAFRKVLEKIQENGFLTAIR